MDFRWGKVLKRVNVINKSRGCRGHAVHEGGFVEGASDIEEQGGFRLSGGVRTRLGGRWCSEVWQLSVRKCGVGGRKTCRDELVDGTVSIVTVLVGGAVLVVMSVFSSMVMMIIR